MKKPRSVGEKKVEAKKQLPEQTVQNLAKSVWRQDRYSCGAAYCSGEDMGFEIRSTGFDSLLYVLLLKQYSMKYVGLSCPTVRYEGSGGLEDFGP
ncbi:hypothetical protein MG293_004474 [Ovis ammon polii]|uniref:Uncharacterized protein n=2 Tax=Ovis TaxID=9935 RepID=A0A836AMP0_SHEEP|nr:hypothetical protein JEQ12_009626 [Ovis aries]KAI4544208.1 hypothetical protein MG293_004474 [Ovis ammon polii]